LGSEGGQRISRENNCVICVEKCEISPGDLGLIVIDDLPEMIGWVKGAQGYGRRRFGCNALVGLVALY